jgi:hypothetical protein
MITIIEEEVNEVEEEEAKVKEVIETITVV